jgi:hypothetical protein
MNIATLKSLSHIKGIRQADIAVMAGVSRQAVHHWWVSDQENFDVLSSTQERLAESLGVPMQLLSKKLPVLSDEAFRKKLETQLLWDRIYPDLEHFVRGLVLGNLDALARLVQVYGLFAAEKIIGLQVWRKFPQYKNKIHPARRRTLEIVWTEIQNPT